jgi:hypothetical protein
MPNTIRLPRPRVVKLEAINPLEAFAKLRASLPSSEFGFRIEYYDVDERSPALPALDSPGSIAPEETPAKNPVGHPVRHDPDKCWCIRCRLIEEKGGEPSLKDWREAIIKATVPGEKWLRDLRKEKRAEETTSADEPPQS